MSDLLPCPFCGGANLGLLRHVSYFPHGVMCRDCFSSATSIERWNKRTLAAVQPHVNETPKTEQDREDVLTPDAAEQAIPALIAEVDRLLGVIEDQAKLLDVITKEKELLEIEKDLLQRKLVIANADCDKLRRETLHDPLPCWVERPSSKTSCAP